MTRKRKQAYNTVTVRRNISKELRAAKSITEGYEEPPSSNPGNAFLNLMTSHTLIALSRRRRILPNSSFTYLGQNMVYHIWNIRPDDPALDMIPATHAKTIRNLRKNFTAAFYAQENWQLKTTRVFENAFLSILAITETLMNIEKLNGQTHPLFCTRGFTQITDKIYYDLCLLQPNPLSRRITELIRIKDVKRHRDKFINYQLQKRSEVTMNDSSSGDLAPSVTVASDPPSAHCEPGHKPPPMSRRRSLTREDKTKITAQCNSPSSGSDTEILVLSPAETVQSDTPIDDVPLSTFLSSQIGEKFAFLTTQDIQDRRLFATSQPVPLPLSPDSELDLCVTETEAEDIFADFNSPDPSRKARAGLTALIIKYGHIKDFVLGRRNMIEALQANFLHQVTIQPFHSPGGTCGIPLLHITVNFGREGDQSVFTRELEEALCAPTYFFPYDYIAHFQLDGALLTTI